VELHCVCREPHDGARPLVACDACQAWFHPDCVGAGPEVRSTFLPALALCCRNAGSSGHAPQWHASPLFVVSLCLA